MQNPFSVKFSNLTFFGLVCRSHSWFKIVFRELFAYGYSLRELGSYILRDTPKPRQLKAPGPKPTIKQLKEAREGNGSPCKGSRWPRKWNGPLVKASVQICRHELDENHWTWAKSATTQNLVVKFDGEIAVEFWWKMLLTNFPSKSSSKISFQTSLEVRHHFRQKLRQLHSGNRWCLKLS